MLANINDIKGKTRAQHVKMLVCDKNEQVIQHVRWWMTTNEQIVVAFDVVQHVGQRARVLEYDYKI